MKKIRRIQGLLLCVILTGSLLTACGDVLQAPSSYSDSGVKTSSAEPEKEVPASLSVEPVSAGTESGGQPEQARPSSIVPETEEAEEPQELQEEPASENEPAEPIPENEPDRDEPAPAEPEETPVEEPSEPWLEASVGLDPGWEFADRSVICTGTANLYRAGGERKNIIIGVNAGHGCAGGENAWTPSHPDDSPKVTGGTNPEGVVMSTSISSGMTFFDGTAERDVNLWTAQIFKDLLLENGYDVLMVRDGDDVQLDNIARTVICSNIADCHIAIHYDGDGLEYDKGCFYMSIPDGIKGMYPVSEIWPESDRLGSCLIEGLASRGCMIWEGGFLPTDLTQTSYSTIPSVDIELGNAASDHSEEALTERAAGLLAGINLFFGME